ncbi:hypothetical protein EDC04DRAFT_718822 [Pisolithus marmoratus]|nr:hypothetical protein EDC04DRAFT_718822 [Pisolithus marmoratus]
MLSRSTASPLHPPTHVGHGLEFSLKGMIVEGLALAAVQDVDGKDFFPMSFFTENAQVTSGVNTHVFDIVARMIRDDNLKVENVQVLREYKQAVDEHVPRIRDHITRWTIDVTKDGDIERKVEELIWLTSALYAIGGFNEVKGFTGEFFLTHPVASSPFPPSLIKSLTPGSQALLLRAYLVMVLTWWVARGRPVLNIKSFMASTSTRLPDPTSEGSGSSIFPKEHPNPFFPIIQSSISHTNDHLPKIQRSFAHFSTVYGNRPAGYHKGIELEGAELFDGSLFVQEALMTANYMGEVDTWSLTGFF